VPAGQPCVVRRIDEHLQTQLDHMRELESGRLLPGQRVTVSEGDEDTVTLDVDGVQVELDRVVAAEVYVTT
jgi:hypothetical protein